jgi:type IV pilus assembly protein PilW
MMRKHLEGFSLIELLIALGIGVFMTVVLLTTYQVNKRDYTQQDQRARLQENLRFALDFIGKDLRQAVNLGCAQGFANIAIAPEVTADAERNAIITAQGLIGANAATNTGTTIEPTPGNTLVGTGGGLRGVNYRNTASGSLSTSADYYTAVQATLVPDRLYLMTTISGPYRLTAKVNAGAKVVNNIQSTTGFTSDAATVTRFALITDCNGGRGDLFQVQSITGTSITAATSSGFGGLSFDYNAPTSLIYEIAFVAYDVYFAGGTEGIALARRPVGPSDNRQAVVSYIENLQVLYGVDSDADGSPNFYQTATVVGNTGNWPNVVSLQVTVVGQSPGIQVGVDPAYQLPQAHWDAAGVTNPGNLVHRTDLNQQLFGYLNGQPNPRHRQVLTATFSLRNRLP